MALSDLSQPQVFTIFIKFVQPLLIAIGCCLHNYPPPGVSSSEKTSLALLEFTGSAVSSIPMHNTTQHNTSGQTDSL